jgi:hypothetical protein
MLADGMQVMALTDFFRICSRFSRRFAQKFATHSLKQWRRK